MFIRSPDGTRIAYEVEGAGPALLLLQGLEEERGIWWRLGHGDRLAHHFTVITIDRRGIGESDMPERPEAYSVDRLLDDVQAVIDDTGFTDFLVWGHSFGGSIGLQLAVRSKRVRAAVIAGSFCGRVYPPERVSEVVGMWDAVLAAQTAGTLGELEMDAEESEIVERTNIPALIACWSALVQWPVVEPTQITCPFLIYAGSEDTRVAGPLFERRRDIEAAGGQVRIFDGLDHEQEIFQVDVVLPPVLEFLLAKSGQN